jgi:hypothetical protein
MHPLPDAAHQPQDARRLAEIETDLLARRARAEAEGWLGELEGIDTPSPSCATNEPRHNA